MRVTATTTEKSPSVPILNVREDSEEVKVSIQLDRVGRCGESFMRKD